MDGFSTVWSGCLRAVSVCGRTFVPLLPQACLGCVQLLVTADELLREVLGVVRLGTLDVRPRRLARSVA